MMTFFFYLFFYYVYLFSIDISIVASSSLKALGSKSECLSSLELCSIFINDKHDICIQSFTHMDGVLPKMENIKSNELNQDEKCSLGIDTYRYH